MRIVTWSELAACPPGTIWCDLEEGYANSLIRKGETDSEGWFSQRELLPQPVGRGASLVFPPGTMRPPPYPDEIEAARFHVFESEDIAHLVKMLTEANDD